MMRNYLLRHLQVLFYSLGQMARAPFAALVTVAVIGVSLSLPAGLYLLLDNLRQLSAGWDESVQLSVFLKPDTSERTALDLAGKLRALPEVAAVHYISRDQALAEFKRLSGVGEALKALETNPLPPVLSLRPAADADSPEQLAALARRLEGWREVDFVQLDIEWVRRLQAVLALAERGLYLLAGLLGLGVLLVVGHASRAAVHSRRSEIEIITLVGGTSAFIRRPFLYGGLLHGLLGAALAWALLALSLVLLSSPARELADLYGSGFVPGGLGPVRGLVLLGLGALLGWLGARIALIGALRRIEPA